MMAALASSLPLLPWRFAAASAGSVALALMLVDHATYASARAQGDPVPLDR